LKCRLPIDDNQVIVFVPIGNLKESIKKKKKKKNKKKKKKKKPLGINTTSKRDINIWYDNTSKLKSFDD